MRDVDQVFYNEIQRESYIRALTDDFSVVDTVMREDSNDKEE